MPFWPQYYLPVLRDPLNFRDRYDDLFRDFWGPSFPSMTRELQAWDDQFGRLMNDVWDLVPAIEAPGRVRPVHALEFTDPSQCFITDPQGKPQFQIQFNVRDYKPEEVAVSTKGNQLLVAAKHGQKTDDMVEYREFNRRIDLPPNVLPESVTSTLSRDGILSVSAPVQTQAIEAAKSEGAVAGGGPQQNALIAKEAGGPVLPNQGYKRFAFQLPIAGFRPEEIKVETNDRVINITGCHEVKCDGQESVYSFKKEYLLPPNADKERLHVYIKDGRRLIVEAPISDANEPQPQPQPQVHVVPIDHK